MEIREGDLVIATVKKIEGTTVFVEIEDSEIKGSIVFSEIAAGRIRNIREYVVPNKKIVCKILEVKKDHFELSFRRVTGKEREEKIKEYEKEQTSIKLIRVISPNYEKIVNKIKEKQKISEFLDNIKNNQEEVKNLFTKEEIEKLEKIVKEKKEKPRPAKGLFTIKSNSEDGINDIKKLISLKEAEIKYLGSSRFSIEVLGKDFKESNNKLNSIINSIEEKAKNKKITFEFQEKWNYAFI